jgi:hypothetical protein
MTLRFALSTLMLAASPTVLFARQQPVPPPPPPLASVNSEAAGLMQGWALMAQGQPGQAEGHAKSVLASTPRSVGAIVLAIESGVAAHGPAAGLDHYDRWIGQRSLEEPALLRRVALGFVQAEARHEGSSARWEALKAIAEDAGGGRVPPLDPASEGPAAVRLRASLGDAQAIRLVIEDLQSGGSNKTAAIEALAQSRSPRALPAIAAQLKDSRPEVRAAAAEGLGQLGLPEAVPLLKSSQSDQSPYVRTKVAAALLKLNDTSGLPLLRELLIDDAPASRLAGAQALADAPDGAWLQVVRDLARSGEPTIRLAAAKLIFSHDPELARSVVDALAADRNLAVRELATRAQAETVGRDLSRLRALLRSSDPLTRVNAARAILSVTK